MHRHMMTWLKAGITVFTVLSISACFDHEQKIELTQNVGNTTIYSSLQMKNGVNTRESASGIDKENVAREYGNRVYQILLAEYHYQHGDYQKSSYLYLSLLAKMALVEEQNREQENINASQSANHPSRKKSQQEPSKVVGVVGKEGSRSNDTTKNSISSNTTNSASKLALVKRATELALKIEDYDQALDLAQLWKKLAPNSSSVNQYLILLYQKKELFEQSAKVLDELVSSYPTQKAKPIDVAVALLEQQRDSKAAYQTLRYYHKIYAKEDEASYYLAIFAMRAGLFDEVLVATKGLQGGNNKELSRKSALLRVKAYTQMDKPEKALEELKKLIAEAADPETRQAYARLMASLGRVQQAVKMLEQVYEKNPDKYELLQDMIAINIGEERYQQCLPLIDKLQTVKGQETTAQYFRGVVYESQKKYREALKEYRSIDDDKRTMQVHSRIVAVLKQTEGLQSVQDYLHAVQKVSKGKPYEGRLYLLESELLRDANQFKQALEVNQKAEKLAPGDLDILYSQALLYEDVSQIDKSEEQLLKILDIDENHTLALNALGYMLSVHTTRFDEAYQYIKRAYDLKPEDPAIIDSLGWVSYRRGDLKGAEKYLRLAYQKLKDPEVASHLVEVLAKQGQQKEATNLLAELLKEYPENKLLIKTQEIIKKLH